MNEIFDFSRFGKYFLYDGKRAWSNYGLTLSILAFMPVILYLMISLISLAFDGSWGSVDYDNRNVVMIMSGIILTVSFPVVYYGRITQKQTGSQWLMIPSSTTEKFVSMLLYTLIIVPVSALVVYFACDWLICLLDPSCGVSLLSRYVSGTEMFPKGLLGSVWAWELMFLLGSLVFRRNKVGKTVLCFLCFSLLCGGLVFSLTRHGAMDSLYELFTRDSLDYEKVLLRVTTLFSLVVLILLGIGIYVRIKTLKH